MPAFPFKNFFKIKKKYNREECYVYIYIAYYEFT